MSFKQAVVVIMFVFDKTVPVPCKTDAESLLGGYCSSRKDDPEGGEFRTDV